jgi:hypothetical protein
MIGIEAKTGGVAKAGGVTITDTGFNGHRWGRYVKRQLDERWYWNIR